MEDGEEVVVGHRRGVEWRRVGYGLHRRDAGGRDPSDRQDQGPEHGAGRARPLGDLRAWQLLLPEEACFTHLTAAAAWGLWLPPVPAGMPVHVSLPKDADRPRRPELRPSRLSRVVIPQLVDGVRLAPVPETLLACARDLRLLDLVVLTDSAVRLGLCAVAEIGAVAAPRRRGAPALRAALELVDPRAESPWESVLRVFHVLCEVPVEPQKAIVDESGRFVARADLWLVGTRTLHEYDGAVHRDRRVHHKDLARERAIANAGWTRRGYTSADLLGRAHLVLREADAALGRAHDSRRLEAWYAALRESLFSAAGRADFLRKLGR